MHTSPRRQYVPRVASLLCIAFLVGCGATDSPEGESKLPREHGSPLTIAQFVAICEKVLPGPSSPPRSACDGYVIGFVESAGLLEYSNRTEPRYCLPVEVSPGELARIVIEQAPQAPGPDYPVAMLLRAELESRFPCPEVGPSDSSPVGPPTSD
jgi:hypothetical protein